MYNQMSLFLPSVLCDTISDINYSQSCVFPTINFSTMFILNINNNKQPKCYVIRKLLLVSYISTELQFVMNFNNS